MAFQFKSTGLKSRGTAKSYGSSGSSGQNALQLLMLKQLMKEEEKKSGLQNIQESVGRFESGAPPGAKITISPDSPSATIPLTKDLTLDEARSVSSAGVIGDNISFIESLIRENPIGFRNLYSKAAVHIPVISGQTKGNVFGIPTTIGNTKAQLLADALNDIQNRILYLRSGAQINQAEYGRLASNMPGYFDDIKTIRTKLAKINDEMTNIRNLTLKGQYYNEKGVPIVYDASRWEQPIPNEKGDAEPPSYKRYMERMNQRFGETSQLNNPQNINQNDDPLGVYSGS